MNRIPKTINYCWFGGKPKSKLIKKCINSWKKMCPDYEIIEWNESNFEINMLAYTKEAYEEQKWAFVTDFVRLYVIYNNGGIYLDTDVELIKPLDSLLQYDSFFSMESDQYIATGLGFGAKKNNELIKQMLDDYKDIHFKDENGNIDLTPCPQRNTESINNIFEKIDDKNNITIINNNAFLSKEYFCPYDPATGIMKKTENTFGIHWYNASWRNNKINFQRKILRPIKRIIGKNNFEKIKKILKKSKKV